MTRPIGWCPTCSRAFGWRKTSAQERDGLCGFGNHPMDFWEEASSIAELLGEDPDQTPLQRMIDARRGGGRI